MLRWLLVAYWSANEQWRLERGPDSEMCPRFLCSEIAVPDLKHVKIVVAKEVAILEEENAMVDDGHFVKSMNCK